jgi:metal-responsive CopG/Arc/MetJ family transcriptional regulator
MSKKKTARITVYIPIEINEALTMLAEANPVLNKSDIIKLALANYLAQNDQILEEIKKERNKHPKTK